MIASRWSDLLVRDALEAAVTRSGCGPRPRCGDGRPLATSTGATREWPSTGVRRRRCPHQPSFEAQADSAPCGRRVEARRSGASRKRTPRGSGKRPTLSHGGRWRRQALTDSPDSPPPRDAPRRAGSRRHRWVAPPSSETNWLRRVHQGPAMSKMVRVASARPSSPPAAFPRRHPQIDGARTGAGPPRIPWRPSCT